MRETAFAIAPARDRWHPFLRRPLVRGEGGDGMRSANRKCAGARVRRLRHGLGSFLCHDRRMGNGRTRSTTPDLFSTASARVPSPSANSPSSTPSYALPKNLPVAIRYLDDDQLDRLLAAVLAEQRRRGKKVPVSDNNPRKALVKVDAPPLPQGKLNAIRAAFKAGFTPSRIARQFRISKSDVKKALASDPSK